MESILNYMAAMVLCTGITWSASGTLGLMLKVKKLYIATLTGPLTGMLLYGAGFLPTPREGSAFSWIFAAFSGLMCTLAAKLFADHGPAAITNTLKRGTGE